MIITKRAVFIILLWILSAAGISQEITDLKFAEYLYNTGQFYDAITEYKRVLFFNNGHKLKADIFYKIGICYKNGGFPDNSLFYITKAIENETDNRLRNTYQFEFAKIMMKKGDYTTAKMELEDLMDRKLPSSMADSVNYFLGWSEISMLNWLSAENYFKNIKKSSYNTSQLFKSCIEGKKLKYKSAVKAILLSTFIPGAGQIYAGELLDGIIAFVLNAGIIYYLTDSILDKRYTDTALIYYFLFGRFYPANRANAYKYAVQYNIDLNKNFLKKIKNAAGFQF
ncbi:tol-pal system YbgF family protein [candidate division KSB1 bacterium]